MADQTTKMIKAAGGVLRPGEEVLAAFRAKFRGLGGLKGAVAPTSFSASKKARDQVQAGWPMTVSADGGTLVGLTRARLLVTQVPSAFRRSHDVRDVPLGSVTVAAVTPSSPGWKTVTISLATGAEVRLDAFSRDEPDRFVALLNEVIGHG